MRRTNPPLRQNAFVVADLRAALTHWTGVLEVGPFFVYEHVDYGGLQYAGRATDVDASVAIGWWGDVQIELIEQHNGAPSIYRDFLAAGRRGLHHVGVYSDDYDADLARCVGRGLAVVQSGGSGIGVRFCYVDDGQSAGPTLELIEHTPAIRELNARMREAASVWDGTKPVRRAVQ